MLGWLLYVGWLVRAIQFDDTAQWRIHIHSNTFLIDIIINIRTVIKFEHKFTNRHTRKDIRAVIYTNAPR